MKRIKDRELFDRPREKLLKYGPERLTDRELFSILIGSGTKKESALGLATRVAKVWNNKSRSFTPSSLRKLKGIGNAKAANLIAAIEIGKRYIEGQKRELLYGPEDVWNACSDFRSHKKEHFAIFFLDAKNQEIKREIVSVGTLTASLVHPREVFEKAISCNAAQLLCVHNHPSGNLSPSRQDIAVTKRLKKAGDILGITVIDHVIITSNGYASIV